MSENHDLFTVSVDAAFCPGFQPICLTIASAMNRDEAIGRAIEFADSYAPDDTTGDERYSATWPKDRKWAFLRQHGARMNMLTRTIAINGEETPIYTPVDMFWESTSDRLSTAATQDPVSR